MQVVGHVVVVVIVVVVHVDRGVGLLVVGRHREGGLIRIDVLVVADLLVARQVAVLLVVAQRVGANESR